MMRYAPSRITILTLGVILVGLSTAANADLSATDIMTKAYRINGGDDSESRLTFTFHAADGTERKLAYTMAWKKYPDGGDVSSKAIFFSDFPPDDKGKAYMIWVSADHDHQDDEWMYLPELRMVRKITHDQGHRHKDKEDEFARSLLTQVNLVPRDPTLDHHTLLEDETFEAHADFVVDSVPKQITKTFPYGKTRHWINQETFVPDRVNYYTADGHVVLVQTFKWQKVGDAWVWEQVVGAKPKSEERTVLDVSDIRINNQLSDEVFSSRSMRLGKDSLP